MAKRTRYPGRPAPRRPGARPAPAVASPTVRSGGLTAAELERAAALEADLVAREKTAQAESARRRARGRPIDTPIAALETREPLSVRAAHEYAYVARDVRRIGLTAGLMFLILTGLWIIVNLGGVNLA